MPRPEVKAALQKCIGIFMPGAGQNPDGDAAVSLGAKGVVEMELVASGEKWGRGPRKDVHSSNRARLDSPAFHLVQALATLVTKDGDPAIDGFAQPARPVSAAERAMLDRAAVRIGPVTLFAGGTPYDERAPEAASYLQGREIDLEVDLGTGGSGRSQMWTCDLSAEYVRINAEYRT